MREYPAVTYLFAADAVQAYPHLGEGALADHPAQHVVTHALLSLLRTERRQLLDDSAKFTHLY